MFAPDDDPDDAAFHARFAGLRAIAVHVVRGLTDRVKGAVARAERPGPQVAEVLVGGLAELLNLASHLVMGDREPDDEEEPDGR